jgi:hypothetical protein
MKRFDEEALKARILARMQKQLEDAKKEEEERAKLEIARDYFGDFEGVNAPMRITLEEFDGGFSAIIDTFADSLAEVKRYTEHNLSSSKWQSSKCVTAPFNYPSQKETHYI